MFENLNAQFLENVEELGNVEQQGITKLSQDMKDAATKWKPAEARYFVDYYYQLQNDRIRAKNQKRASDDADEPNAVVLWISDNTAYLEKQIQLSLKAYAESKFVGRWSKSVHGVGPVISAGLLAHIDISKANNVGHILSFAGMLPNKREWLKADEAKKRYERVIGKSKVLTASLIREITDNFGKSPEAMCQHLLKTTPRHYAEGVSLLIGTKITAEMELKEYLTSRPHNAKLKVLLWKIGESFVKFSNSPKDFYGKVYQAEKARLVAVNEAGGFADQAAAILAAKNFGKTTDAYKAYIVGKLPPAHLQARACRKSIHLFLSHWWEVSYRYTYPDLECPRPYSIDHLGRKHYIPIHNDPF